MAKDDFSDVDDWEKYKFHKEIEIEEARISLERDKLGSDAKKNLMIGLLVPVALAIITGLPTYLTTRSQQALQQTTFEANLITESVRTGDPDQAATNLAFLVNSGLLTGATAERVQAYLERRPRGQGRALPPG